jgi:hypothetical protein
MVMQKKANLSRLTRRISMKKILLSAAAIVCLAGFSPAAFADEMGSMKDEMKGEMKGEMGAMKDAMKAKKDAMKGEMTEAKTR